jgi:hypothetical protein
MTEPTFIIMGISMRKSFALLLVLVFLTGSWMIVAKPALSSIDVAENSWTSKAPMQQARAGLGVAVVNGKIYAIGGSNVSGIYPPIMPAGGFVGTSEEYDPATDTWTFKTPMPTPRAYFAVVAYQNKIYCIGGVIGIGQGFYDGTSIPVPIYLLSGVNEVYDPATDTWETKASMPTARMQVHANVVGDRIYIVDGFDRREAPNEVYDPVTDSWTKKAPMPAFGSHHASAVVDNKMYVVANDIYAIDEKDERRLFIYDAETDGWSQGTPAPSIVFHGPAVATIDVMAPKRIYTLGVQLGNDPPPTNYVYDPKNDSWMVGATMHINRMDFGAAVIDDKLYAIGGYTFNDSPNSGRVTVSAVNEEYTPIGYGTIPPKISVVSPESRTYNVSSVPLIFAANRLSTWTCYSLDGLDNVTITGNTTLTGLSNGLHNLTVYAKDAFENVGASETVYFTIAEEPEPFPTTWIVGAAAIIAIGGAAALVYFRRTRKTTEKVE